jgi:RNA polymerase primary sigma factor
MSVAELRELEEVKGLITRGEQVGVLTYAEIATATSELALDETDLEELHGLFERCEIELVEEIDPATAASLKIERAPESAAAARLRWISGWRGRPTHCGCSSGTSARCVC